MAVGVGLLVGGLAAAGASAYAASSSASAQGQAAATAASAQEQANNLNYKMYQQAHGAYGNAVLPDYMGSFEKTLGTDLQGAFNSTQVPLTTFQAAVGQLAPAQAGAVKTTNSIFNGDLTGTMLANNAPVQQARLVQANNAVTTARNSSLDALHQTLNEIDSQQAARGFVGDSYASRLLKFQAGQSAGTAIGQAQSGVDAAALQNAQDTANIKQYGNVTLPLQNLSTPYSMAQQNAQFQALPQTQYIQNLSNSMQPLNFVKIGYTGPYQYQTLPTPGAGAYSGTANALSSLGGTASGYTGAALQYYLQGQNQQSQQLAQQNLLSQYMAAQSASPEVASANALTGQFAANAAATGNTGLWTSSGADYASGVSGMTADY